MEHMELWLIVVFAVVITSCMLIASVTEPFEVIPMEPPLERNFTQPPENATLIPDLGSIPFDLSLGTPEITVTKGQSLNMTVTIYSTEKVDLLLRIAKEDDPLPLVPFYTPELPPGIIAYFDQDEITVKADSEVIVNLTLLVDDQATAGTYTLQVSADQKTFYGSHGVCVPFKLTIP